MAQYELNQLAKGTEFTYGTKSYKKGISTSNSRHESSYIGEKKELCKLIECYPKLGGVYQEQLPDWFNADTKVEVL